MPYVRPIPVRPGTDSKAIFRYLASESTVPAQGAQKIYASEHLALLHRSILKENSWEYRCSSPMRELNKARGEENKYPAGVCKTVPMPAHGQVGIAALGVEDEILRYADCSDEEDQTVYPLGIGTPRSLRCFKFQTSLASVSEDDAGFCEPVGKKYSSVMWIASCNMGCFATLH